MAMLPIDLITLILARLPVKSLQLFKSVSKEWNSLISSHYFIELHLNHSPCGGHIDDHHLIMIIKNNDKQSQYIECRAIDSHLTRIFKFNLPFELNKKKGRSNDIFRLCCSCNGLVLIEHKYDFKEYMKTELIMWNPMTNSRFVVPLCELSFFQIIKDFSRFIEDYDYGLGYDRSNNDYKLIRIHQRLSMGIGLKTSTQVYSSKRDSWGEPAVLENDGNRLQSRGNGLIDNHIIHWIFLADSIGMCIRGFDINSEEWLQLPLPDLSQGHTLMNLGVLDNCLCVRSSRKVQSSVEDIYSYEFNVTHVWIMKEYGVNESWINLLNISHCCSIDCPVTYSGTGDEVLINMLYRREDIDRYLKGFYWYNLEDRRTRIYAGDCDCNIDKIMLSVSSLVQLPRRGKASARCFRQLVV